MAESVMHAAKLVEYINRYVNTKEKPLYMNICNLITNLRDKLEIATQKTITRPTYWEVLVQDATKILQMARQVNQQSDSSVEEETVVNMIENLITSLNYYLAQTGTILDQNVHVYTETKQQPAVLQQQPIKSSQTPMQPSMGSIPYDRVDQRIEARLREYQDDMQKNYLGKMEKHLAFLHDKIKKIDSTDLIAQIHDMWKKAEGQQSTIDTILHDVSQLQSDLQEIRAGKQTLLSRVQQENQLLQQQVRTLETKLLSIERHIGLGGSRGPAQLSEAQPAQVMPGISGNVHIGSILPPSKRTKK